MKAKCKCWHSCFGAHESQGTHADSSDHTASQAPANGIYSEKLQETPKSEYGSQNDSSWGEPGIVYADDAVGLKVMGFKTGSSAASNIQRIIDPTNHFKEEMKLNENVDMQYQKHDAGLFLSSSSCRFSCLSA
jgi:hypothetical protein